jgi:pyruvate dehydrogenase complex dehydrogenase (E1) component
MFGLNKLTLLAIGAVVLAIAAGAIGAVVNGWRLGKELETTKLTHTKALLDAAEKAAERQTDMEVAKNEAIEKAQAEATKLAADAARAKSERDRLRRDLQASRDALSNATCPSTTAHAQTLNELFAECVERYSEVAAAADAHALDAETIFRSWKAVKEAE